MSVFLEMFEYRFPLLFPTFRTIFLSQTNKQRNSLACDVIPLIRAFWFVECCAFCRKREKWSCIKGELTSGCIYANNFLLSGLCSCISPAVCYFLHFFVCARLALSSRVGSPLVLVGCVSLLLPPVQTK